MTAKFTAISFFTLLLICSNACLAAEQGSDNREPEREFTGNRAPAIIAPAILDETTFAASAPEQTTETAEAGSGEPEIPSSSNP